jgi:hypothetical protein
LDITLETLSEAEVSTIYTQYLGKKDGLRSQAGAERVGIEKEDEDLSDLIRSVLDIISSHLSTSLPDVPQTYKSCLKTYISFIEKHPNAKPTPAIKKAIAEIVLKRKTTRIARQPSKSGIEVGPEKITSTYGGLFLLLTSVLDLRLNDLISQSPFPDQADVSRLQFFLIHVALRIIHQDSREPSQMDRGIYLFAGLEKTVSILQFEKYTETITPTMIEEFLKSLVGEISARVEREGNSFDFLHVSDILSGEGEEIGYQEMIAWVAELIHARFAHQLIGFEKSSPRYLFTHFLHRHSEIVINPQVIHVTLSPKPLDAVLRLSGHLDEINRVPWLGNRSVQFTLGH